MTATAPPRPATAPPITEPVYQDHRGRLVPVTRAILEDLIHGRRHFARRDVSIPYQLTRAQLAIFRQAQRTGMLWARNSQANEALRNAFWLHCETERLPFVWVKPRRMWAAVELDPDPIWQLWEPSEHAQRQVEQLWIAQGRSTWVGYSNYWHHEHVALDQADRVARRLIAIARADMAMTAPLAQERTN